MVDGWIGRHADITSAVDLQVDELVKQTTVLHQLHSGAAPARSPRQSRGVKKRLGCSKLLQIGWLAGRELQGHRADCDLRQVKTCQKGRGRESEREIDSLDMIRFYQSDDRRIDL